MKRTSAFLIVCSVGTLAATAAESAEHRFYGGVSVGNSSVDGRAQAQSTMGSFAQLPASLSINTLPFDDEDTAWSAFMGYSATEYVGLEIGYWNHGEFKSRLTGPDPGSLSIEELYFGATLRYPLAHRFALTGSAGISRAQFDVDGSIAVVVVTTPIIPTLPFPVLPPGSQVPLPGIIQSVPLATPKDETGGYWRVGLNWRVTDAVEAGVSYGKRDLQVQQVETLALSVLYAF